MKLKFVTIIHKDWVNAAEAEGFDPYEDSTDDLEESWGLSCMGYADEEEPSGGDYSFKFMIIDKRKWFLAKIKHGL